MPILVALEIGSATNTERYDDSFGNPNWEPVASAQAPTEVEAKALILDNILEALNCEDLLPSNEWLRLSYYDMKARHKAYKVEVF